MPLNSRELLASPTFRQVLVNVVHGRGPTAGKALASSPRIGMISFTGSIETGSAIMGLAAANITKLTSNSAAKRPLSSWPMPTWILLFEAVRSSRVINSGQVCNCAERVYVQRNSRTSLWTSSLPR